MAKAKRGPPIDYDKWIPRYTNKTGKVTKKSREDLNAIRSQKLFESTFKNMTTNDIIEAVSFGAGVYTIKGGFDFVRYLLGLILGDTPGETAMNIYKVDMKILSFVPGPIGTVAKITDATIESILPRSRVERLVNDAKNETNTEVQNDIDSKELSIKSLQGMNQVTGDMMEHLRALISGGNSPLLKKQIKPEDSYHAKRTACAENQGLPKGRPDCYQFWDNKIKDAENQIKDHMHTIAQRDIVIAELKKEISNLKLELGRIEMTDRAKKKFDLKLELEEYAYAGMMMGGLRWFLKSYESYEAIDNINPLP